MRDIWLDDDQPGCLECGALVFRASKLSGVCVECLNDTATIFASSSHDYFEESYSFIDYSTNDGDDDSWTETF